MRSYSYMPALNVPTTLNERQRGITPAGVVLRIDVTSTTRSPTLTSSARASSAPSTMPYSPGARLSNEPLTIFSAIEETFLSSIGSTPITIAPLLLPAPISKPCSSI